MRSLSGTALLLLLVALQPSVADGRLRRGLNHEPDSERKLRQGEGYHGDIAATPPDDGGTHTGTGDNIKEEMEKEALEALAFVINEKCPSTSTSATNVKDLETCEHYCLPGECCFKNTIIDGGCPDDPACSYYENCRFVFELLEQSHQEAGMLTDSTAYAGEDEEDIEEIAAVIDEMCTSSRPNDLEVCKRYCASADCCFADGAGSCSSDETCMYYMKCQVLMKPVEEVGKQAYVNNEDSIEDEESDNEKSETEALEELQLKINEKCVSQNPDDLNICRKYCSSGACCFPGGTHDCSDDDACMYYMKCQVLYGQDAEIPEAGMRSYANVDAEVEDTGECETDDDCPTYDPCTKYTCAKDGLTGSTYCADTPVLDCCLDDEDCLDEDECNGAEVCQSNRCVAGPPFVESCEAKPCYEAVCAVDVNHRPSCQYEHIDGCGANVVEDDEDEESEEEALDELALIINEKCTSSDENDLEICKRYCVAGSCCFTKNVGSCSGDKACQYYMKCQVLYGQDAEVSEAGMRSYANVAAAEEEDTDECKTDADCPTYDPCTKYTCTMDGLTGSTYCADTPVLDCCLDDADCLDEDECNGAEICQSNRCVAGPPFVETCEAKPCYEAVCAVNVNHQPSCQYEPIEGCVENAGKSVTVDEDEDMEQEALEELASIISEKCTSSSVTDAEICKRYCAPGACCFTDGRRSCKNDEICQYYKDCEVLFQEDTEAPEAGMRSYASVAAEDEDTDECKTDTDCPTYDPCTKYTCTMDGLTGSNYCADSPVLDCCLDDADCLDEDECNGAEICQSNRCVAGPPFVESCASKPCYEAVCAVNVNHQPSCQYEPIDGCSVNVATTSNAAERGNASVDDEEEELEEEVLAELALIIEEKCLSHKPEDLESCKKYCAPGACCFSWGADSCSDEEACKYYMKCQVLFDQSGV